MKHFIPFCTFVILFSFQLNGQIWFDRSFSEQINLYDIVFIDSLKGFAVGDSALLIKTTDGGIHWNRVAYGEKPGSVLFRIQKSPNGSISILGNDGNLVSYFINSTDGGVTWNEVNFPYPDIYLLDFYQLTTDTVFVCGAGGAVLKSGDNFRSWSMLPDPTNYFTNRKIFFTDSNHGWVCGGKYDVVGYIKFTTTGGATWINGPRLSEPVFDIQKVSADTLYGIGGDPEYGGYIYLTTNSGVSWKSQTIPIAVSTLVTGEFSDARLGWAAGAGSIIATTDRGINWQVVKRCNALISRCIKKNASNWFVGSGGLIYQYIDTGGVITGTPGETKEKFSRSGLSKLYPNPSNNETNALVILNKNSYIHIEVFNLLGKRVMDIPPREYMSGTHTIRISTSLLSSGMYFVRTTTNFECYYSKLILIK